jgi:WD40 repeat protein
MVHVYNTIGGETVSKLRGHQAIVNAVATHPALPILFSGANDNAVLAWSAPPPARPTAAAAAAAAHSSGSDTSDEPDADNWLA